MSLLWSYDVQGVFYILRNVAGAKLYRAKLVVLITFICTQKNSKYSLALRLPRKGALASALSNQVDSKSQSADTRYQVDSTILFQGGDNLQLISGTVVYRYWHVSVAEGFTLQVADTYVQYRAAQISIVPNLHPEFVMSGPSRNRLIKTSRSKWGTD